MKYQPDSHILKGSAVPGTCNVNSQGVFAKNDRVFVNSRGVPGTVVSHKNGQYQVKLDWEVPVIVAGAATVRFSNVNLFSWEMETL